MTFLPECLIVLIILANAMPVCAQVNQSGVWNASPTSSSPVRQQASQRAIQQVRTAATKGKTLDYQDHVQVGPDRRTYHIHVPASYEPSRAMPLVLCLHGAFMNGLMMRGLTLMDLVADREGFIVVYPDGVSNRWNAGGPQNTGTDDVAFIRALLAQIERKYNIDRRRVFACGISNGGFFSQLLACEMSDRIAAIAVVSASAFNAVCTHCRSHRKVPVAFFVGTEDPLVPQANDAKQLGKLGDFLGLTDLGVTSLGGTVGKVAGIMTAQEAVEFWASHNGCSANPRTEQLPDRSTRDGCKVKRESYYGSVPVISYTIDGGGHTWPGGTPVMSKDIFGSTTYDISCSEEIWAFFKANPMR